jgi:hypothetical protein
MNEQEAQAILESHLSHYRALTHEELAALVGGASGAQYCVEVEVSWEDPSRGTIRVLVSIDGGGVRGRVPLCAGCVVAPDGSSGVEE